MDSESTVARVKVELTRALTEQEPIEKLERLASDYRQALVLALDDYRQSLDDEQFASLIQSESDYVALLSKYIRTQQKDTKNELLKISKSKKAHKFY